MADECDIASKEQIEFEERVLRSRMLARSVSVESAENCEDCGEPISADRRAAEPGCTRCVECGSLYESQARRYANRSAL